MSAYDEDPPGARHVSTHTADPAEPTRLVEDAAVRADVSPRGRSDCSAAPNLTGRRRGGSSVSSSGWDTRPGGTRR
jgi:hypothetical protein